jgi:uncharacterized membrane protein YidH (DUF202 family)
MFLEAICMVDEKEQEILATVRTLLALEKNYLAEERTELAEFRTDLAILLIDPAATTVIAYVSTLLDIRSVFLFDVLNFTLFTVLAVWGIWTIIRSRSKLNKIRKNKTLLKARACII